MTEVFSPFRLINDSEPIRRYPGLRQRHAILKEMLLPSSMIRYFYEYHLNYRHLILSNEMLKTPTGIFVQAYRGLASKESYSPKRYPKAINRSDLYCHYAINNIDTAAMPICLLETLNNSYGKDHDAQDRLVNYLQRFEMMINSEEHANFLNNDLASNPEILIRFNTVAVHRTCAVKINDACRELFVDVVKHISDLSAERQLESFLVEYVNARASSSVDRATAF